ncbi:hypothetical protein JRI60_38400 [Archangium violaceum]|uniref:hypothetical protein n=1 Tax=Archangium violaceum TaxID=83451 RepID=UPI0019524BDA|nr:hypothetical protein [Archangium violaceum]QRN94933.1 hypothetical protein JRI60_38400 [Archangium violaceum]
MFRKLVSLALPAVALGLAGCGTDMMEQEPTAQAAEPVATQGQALTSVVLNKPYLPFFVPPLRSGDAEFGGNGPDMDIDFEMELRNNNTELWVGMAIWAREVGGDTYAQGDVWYKVFTAPSPIQSITPVGVKPEGPEFHFGYRDYGHATDTFQFPQTIPASRLVWQLSCVGDTDDKEAGSRTGCSAILHDMTITY